MEGWRDGGRDGIYLLRLNKSYYIRKTAAVERLPFVLSVSDCYFLELLLFFNIFIGQGG